MAADKAVAAGAGTAELPRQSRHETLHDTRRGGDRAGEQARVMAEGQRLLDVLRDLGVKPHTYDLERPFARRTWIRRQDAARKLA